MLSFKDYICNTPVIHEMTKDSAFEYAKNKSRSGNDMEVYHHDGKYHVNHEMNSQGRSNLIKQGAIHVATATDGELHVKSQATK